MKNDVRKRLLLGWAAILCVNCAFMACSDDDDESNSLSSLANPGTIQVGNDRYRIESVGGIEFEYSEDGELTKIDDYEVSNNPFEMKWDYASYCVYLLSDFSFNGAGFITKYTEEEIDEEDDIVSERENYSISYNGSGQVAKITWTGTYVDYDDDDDEVTGKYSGSKIFTWKDGNLIKVVEKESDTYSDGVNESWEYTYDYEYGDVPNDYGQFTYGMYYSETFNTNEGCFACLGLLGKSSKDLPVSITCRYTESYDGYTHDGEDSYDISYSFDENGLIEYEIIDGSRYGYSYIMDGTANHKVIEKTEAPKPLKERARGLRRGHRRHQ